MQSQYGNRDFIVVYSNTMRDQTSDSHLVSVAVALRLDQYIIAHYG